VDFPEFGDHDRLEAPERELGVLTLLDDRIPYLVESGIHGRRQGIQLLLDPVDAIRQRLHVSCHLRGQRKPTIVMAGDEAPAMPDLAGP
jgi:hypothetical protein